MPGHPTRRDWGSQGRRLCDVLARCEATGDFGPYVAALRALSSAADQEAACVEGTGGPLRESAPEPALQIPEKVADHSSRGKF